LIEPERAQLMDDTCAIRGSRERREPTSITLADLSSLVVGAALTFTLPQLHHPTDQVSIGNLPMPGWVACLFVIGEVAMKAGLALTPVIVARRVRYRGLPRPVDWLAILVGLALLHEVVRRLEWMKRFARWYLVDFRSSLGYPVYFSPHERFPGRGAMVGDLIYYGYDGFPAGFTLGDEYRLWGWFATILLVGISAALGFGWKRMPPWVKTGLLSVAAFTWLAGVTYLLTPGLVRASEAISEQIRLPSAIAVQAALGVASLPEGLLFGVPIVAVLLDLRRGAVRDWAWTGWVGAATALLALPTGMVIYWYADLINRADPLATTRLTVRALWLVTVGLSSWVIVKRVGGAGTTPHGS
jgi:hypothetical protein